MKKEKRECTLYYQKCILITYVRVDIINFMYSCNCNSVHYNSIHYLCLTGGQLYSDLIKTVNK